MRSHIQEALLSALEAILRPTVKLLLQSGIGYSEFVSVAKSVFVQVATDEYKRRGRPANFSQVSAMTGISRKEVSRIRKPRSDDRWTPSMEASPVNTVLHEWHFDPDFSDGGGTAKTLPFEGPLSFSTLVSRYVGDIPPGAMRSTLQKAGVLTQNSDGSVSVSQRSSIRTSIRRRLHSGPRVLPEQSWDRLWCTTPPCINEQIISQRAENTNWLALNGVFGAST